MGPKGVTLIGIQQGAFGFDWTGESPPWPLSFRLASLASPRGCLLFGSRLEGAGCAEPIMKTIAFAQRVVVTVCVQSAIRC